MGCTNSLLEPGEIKEEDWEFSNGDYQDDIANIPWDQRSFGIEFVNQTGQKVLITQNLDGRPVNYINVRNIGYGKFENSFKILKIIDNGESLYINSGVVG
jgi:hypothetical protein